MGWATRAIERLQAGEGVTLRPRGHSMRGRVEDGEIVRVEPLGDRVPAKGDVVLCRVHGHEYLHLVLAVQGDRYLIGNNVGGVNGWVGRGAIFGRLVNVRSGL